MKAGSSLLEAASPTHMLSFSSLGTFLSVLANLTLQTQTWWQKSSKPALENRIYLMEVCCRDMHLISILPRYPGWSSWARQTHRTLQSITSSWANRAFLPLGDRREVRLAPDVSEESR